MSLENKKNLLPLQPEQRHYKRIDMELPVELEYNGAKICATTQNISCGGMFIPTQENLFLKDDDVIAFIKLPNQSKSIKLNAKIKRIVKKLQENTDGVALQFDGLYDSNHFEIDRYIKNKIN